MREDKEQVIKNRIVFAVTVFLFMLINFLAGCGTARRGEPVMGKMTLANEYVRHGELVFMENCQRCHPGGEAGVGPPINNLPLPSGFMKWRVRSKSFALGVGRMPSFKKHEIPAGDLNDLVAYLKALRKNDEDTRGSNAGKKDVAKR
jgi:mono/diheme cytochrome c family protein